MKDIFKQLNILNRTIQVNNDRIAGYRKAIELIENDPFPTIREIFKDYIEQSEKFISQLLPLVEERNGNIQNDIKFTGKLFRLWMDLKSGLSSSTTQSVLELCQIGEGEFRDIYHQILNDSRKEFTEIVYLLYIQLVEQNYAYVHIKDLRMH